MPGWHAAVGNTLADRCRPGSRFVIRCQAERANLPLAMTLDAIPIQNRGDVAVIRDARIIQGHLVSLNNATERLGLWHRDFLTREQLVEGRAEVISSRR